MNDSSPPPMRPIMVLGGIILAIGLCMILALLPGPKTNTVETSPKPVTYWVPAHAQQIPLQPLQGTTAWQGENLTDAAYGAAYGTICGKYLPVVLTTRTKDAYTVTVGCSNKIER